MEVEDKAVLTAPMACIPIGCTFKEAKHFAAKLVESEPSESWFGAMPKGETHVLFRVFRTDTYFLVSADNAPRAIPTEGSCSIHGKKICTTKPAPSYDRSACFLCGAHLLGCKCTCNYHMCEACDETHELPRWACSVSPYDETIPEPNPNPASIPSPPAKRNHKRVRADRE